MEHSTGTKTINTGKQTGRSSVVKPVFLTIPNTLTIFQELNGFIKMYSFVGAEYKCIIRCDIGFYLTLFHHPTSLLHFS